MDTYSTVLTLLNAAALGYVVFTRLRASDLSYVTQVIHQVEAGICPDCESVHPEAARHDGPDNFWTVFHCPECGHSLRTHAAPRR